MNKPVYILLRQPWHFDWVNCEHICGTFTSSEVAIKTGLRRMSSESAEDNVSLKAKIVHDEENNKWLISIGNIICYIVVESIPK